MCENGSLSQHRYFLHDKFLSNDESLQIHKCWRYNEQFFEIAPYSKNISVFISLILKTEILSCALWTTSYIRLVYQPIKYHQAFFEWLYFRSHWLHATKRVHQKWHHGCAIRMWIQRECTCEYYRLLSHLIDRKTIPAPLRDLPQNNYCRCIKINWWLTLTITRL